MVTFGGNFHGMSELALLERFINTLEVDTVGAQRLSLAATVGSLSLMLRKAGETTTDKPRRITLDDLTSEVAPKDDNSEMRSVTVRRGTASKEYSVPIEGADKVAVNSGKPKRN